MAGDSPPFSKVLGKALKTLRERQNLSQGQITHRAPSYLARATVSRIELGQVRATDKSIALYLASLGLTTEDLQKEIGDTRVKCHGRKSVSAREARQHPLIVAAR